MAFYIDWGPPLLILRPHGTLTEADVDLWISGYDEAIESQQKFVAVFDTRGVTPTVLKQRGRINAYRKRILPTLGHVQVATIIVIKKRFVRGVLTAITWVSGEFPNQSVVGSIDEAVQTARSALEVADLPVDAATESRLSEAMGWAPPS